MHLPKEISLRHNLIISNGNQQSVKLHTNMKLFNGFNKRIVTIDDFTGAMYTPNCEKIVCQYYLLIISHNKLVVVAAEVVSMFGGPHEW